MGMTLCGRYVKHMHVNAVMHVQWNLADIDSMFTVKSISQSLRIDSCQRVQCKHCVHVQSSIHQLNKRDHIHAEMMYIQYIYTTMYMYVS